MRARTNILAEVRQQRAWNGYRVARLYYEGRKLCWSVCESGGPLRRYWLARWFLRGPGRGWGRGGRALGAGLPAFRQRTSGAWDHFHPPRGAIAQVSCPLRMLARMQATSIGQPQHTRCSFPFVSGVGSPSDFAVRRAARFAC